MAPAKELKLVLWNLPASALPTGFADVASLDVDYSSHPDLIDHLADRWHVVSHDLMPNADGGITLSLFLERPIEPFEQTETG